MCEAVDGSDVGSYGALIRHCGSIKPLVGLPGGLVVAG